MIVWYFEFLSEYSVCFTYTPEISIKKPLKSLRQTAIMEQFYRQVPQSALWQLIARPVAHRGSPR